VIVAAGSGVGSNVWPGGSSSSTVGNGVSCDGAGVAALGVGDGVPPGGKVVTCGDGLGVVVDKLGVGEGCSEGSSVEGAGVAPTDVGVGVGA